MQPSWMAMPDHDYFAHDSIGSTDLKKILESSIAHWRYEKKNPKPRTAEQILGTHLHRIVAFPDDRKLLVKLPELNLKTKQGREDRDKFTENAEREGLIVVDDEDFTDLMGMFESIMAHSVCKAIYGNQGFSELAGFATDERGVSRKIKPDRRVKNIIFDLKTTQLYTAAPVNWRGICFKLNYLSQAAYYLDTANLIEPGGFDIFAWIAVEKKPPYAVCIHQIDDFYLEIGRSRYKKAIDKLLDYQETGKAVAYEEIIHLMSPDNPDYSKE